jgi:hypothetical protein
MEGTVVCFYDKENGDAMMIRFQKVVMPSELYNIKNKIKEKISEAMDNGEYYSVDDKNILKKTLRELGYDYEIIQVSDYVVSF